MAAHSQHRGVRVRGPNTLNSRNELLELRALLKIAYQAMVDQDVMIPGPLRLWMRSHKPTMKQKIAKMTPDGLQQFITNNHLTVEDLKEMER